MTYTNEDLEHEHGHANHGPQPDGEALDASWLTELDNFLSGKHNHLKQHKNFLTYPYEYVDKSFPTEDMAHNLIHKHWNCLSY